MADNITTTAGVLASKDIGSVHYPKNLLTDGAGVEAIGDVSATPGQYTLGGRLKAILDKLLGSIAVTGTFWQATQPVSAAALPLPAGAAVAAKQDSAIAALAALAPATSGAAVTPNDSADLAALPRSLYIGTAGNIVVRGSDDVAVTFPVEARQVLLFRAKRVMATGTTAGGIIALY